MAPCERAPIGLTVTIFLFATRLEGKGLPIVSMGRAHLDGNQDKRQVYLSSDSYNVHGFRLVLVLHWMHGQ